MNTRSKTRTQQETAVAAASPTNDSTLGGQPVASPAQRRPEHKELKSPSKSQSVDLQPASKRNGERCEEKDAVDAAKAAEDEESEGVDAITRHMHKISFGDSMGEVAKISTVRELETALPAICSEVFAVLGQFNLEATYQRALAMELRARGIRVHSEVEIPVFYKKQRVATRRLDLYLQLDSPVILELKAVTTKLSSTHLKQLEYYLTHFNVREGYLINFPHVTGFPDDTGVVYEQETLQPVGGDGVSDRSTRSAKPRKDAQPQVVHVWKAGSTAASGPNYAARLE